MVFFFIENTYCRQSLSTITQFIGIDDPISESPIGQSLLSTLAQIQYPFKIESLCSIIVW